MPTATFIKSLPEWRGDARLYKLDPPMEDDGRKHEHVVVSAVSVFGEPETYIFPANQDGAVTDFGELPGSEKGSLNHESALSRAGYTAGV